MRPLQKLSLCLLFMAAIGLVFLLDSPYEVVSISDGDTITVLTLWRTQKKVRLSHIDAPEKRQAFGTKAKQILGDKIHGKKVRITWGKPDKRYNREVGEVFLGSRNINLEMVQEGYAWHYKSFSKNQTYAAAEIAARKAKLGLWADRQPTPPWSFRK